MHLKETYMTKIIQKIGWECENRITLLQGFYICEVSFMNRRCEVLCVKCETVNSSSGMLELGRKLRVV